jgi:hypothetical protein
MVFTARTLRLVGAMVVGAAAAAASESLPAPRLKPMIVAENATETDICAAFHWHPTEGAREYVVEVATDEQFKRVTYRVSTSGLYAATCPVQSGTYFWRVRPRSSVGVLGQASRPWRFVVKGTDFPLRGRERETDAGKSNQDGGRR